MKVRLLERRPGFKDEGKAKMIPAGTIVTVTGTNVLKRIIAETYDGYGLNFNEDQAEVIDE